MAAVTRLGTNPNTGVSDPGRFCSPAGDYYSLPVTMAEAVQKGQLVALNNVGKGVLAGGATKIPFGVATEKAAIGKRIGLLIRGPMAGYSGLTPGALVYGPATATGEPQTASAANAVVVGRAMENDPISSENTVYFDISTASALLAS